MSYIITSGWYSDTKQSTENGKKLSKFQQRYGGDTCRNSEFSKLWLKCIFHFCKVLPQKILITNSNSPDIIDKTVSSNFLVEMINLTKNFGHGVFTSQINIMSGWSRSVLSGVFYAFLNDIDVFVYIEQDVLVFGRNWLNLIISHMNETKKNICFGSPEDTPQRLQQSLIVIKKCYYSTFLTKMINNKDFKRSDEQQYYDLFKNDMTFLPFKGGRTRKGLDKEYYYKQHMDDKELELEIKKHPFLKL